jgi:uncharacterized membrane protein YbhN (UPF0104 family)
MIARRRRWIVLAVLQVAIAAGLFWLVSRNIHIVGLSESLRRTTAGSVAIAIVALFVERLVRPYRLAVLLGRSTPRIEVIAIQNVSQLVNLILPMRSGEMFLVVALRSLGLSSGSSALSVVAIDRLMDVACVLAIFSLATITVLGLPTYIDRSALVLALVCLSVIIGMITMVLARDRLLFQLRETLGYLIGATRADRWHQRAAQFVEGSSVLLDPPRLMLAITATMVTWACATLAAFAILRAIWADAPIMAAALAVSLSVIGTSVVSVPAGIGVVHAAYAIAGVSFGATQEAGLAFAIVGHFLATAATLVMGLLGMPVAKRAGVTLWSRVRNSPDSDAARRTDMASSSGNC